MRRCLLVILVVTQTAVAPLAEPAHAQLRGLLGAVTRPIRGLFGGGYHHRAARHHEAAHEAQPKASEQAAARPAETPGLNVRETAIDPRNPYEVALGYAFWPDDYGRYFGQYGFGTIAAAIAGPASAGRPREVATTGQSTGAVKSSDILPSCDIGDTATSDWVAGRMKRGLHADATQLRAFDQVRSQLIDGSKAIRSRCRTISTDTPLERLAELKQRIWAVHDADITARPAVAAFYDTLSDRQKAEFKGNPPSPPKGNAAAAPMGQRNQASAALDGGTQALIGQIEQKVRPTHEQQAGLDNLQKVSTQMEKLLLAHYAQATPQSPLARLDAADDQLVALNYAASSLEIALNNFYAGLSDEQKASFDSLGR